MSKVKIQGNASGTAEFTIEAPNGSTNRTLTLPDKTGTLLDSSGQMIDMWRMTADFDAPSEGATISSNLERVDDPSYGGIGTGMTQSSGIFTFPSTGIYLVMLKAEFNPVTADGACLVNIQVTQDNSAYDIVARAIAGDATSSSVIHGACAFATVDVTDVSNVKVKFTAGSMGSGRDILGSTTITYTGFYFMRLGDT